jgi:hypothetical protein
VYYDIAWLRKMTVKKRWNKETGSDGDVNCGAGWRKLAIQKG